MSRAGPLLLTALTLGACSSEKSFALVIVLSRQGELPKIDQFLVEVSNEGTMDSLTFPEKPTPLRLSQTESLSFSVSFPASRTGLLDVGVIATYQGMRLAHGRGVATIDPGHTIRMKVLLDPGGMEPDAGVVTDGGGEDAGQMDSAPGNLDAPTACQATMPQVCGATATCAVSCDKKTNEPVSVCTASGPRKIGEECSKNEDCVTGSQCLEFPCKKVCLQLCQEKKDCTVPGTTCLAASIPCGMKDTGFRICSQACDPRGDASKGCPAPMRCFIYKDEVVDCDCVGATNVHGDGEGCTDSRDCLPGFLCVTMSGVNTCRATCRRDAPDCMPGKSCEELKMPDYVTFGACMPM